VTGAGTEPPEISIRGVSKSYGRVQALETVSLEVAPSTIVSVVGPSGCGKTTLLHLVAGLIDPSDGVITVGGMSPRELRGLGKIGLIFQDEALLPWRSVAENVRLPLDLLPARATQGSRDIGPLLDLVGLSSFAQALPRQLSGGMRRRVSIARALVTRPAILLLDEPFGALDEPLRQRLMMELEQIWLEEATTALLVTHSVSEAVFLSDRVLVFSAGPGSILASVEISVPRPRGDSFVKSGEYHHFHDQIMEVFPIAD